ncbi:MAG: PHB depolymerase family esterase [Paracoccaceae bacterium]
MTKMFADAIRKATELTKSGRLKEATAFIQSTLKGGTDDVEPADQAVVEGEFTRIDKVDSEPVRRPGGIGARQRLSDTLLRLAAGGVPTSKPFLSPANNPLPDGAEFLSLSHTGMHGSRNYRLYVPSNRTTEMPLIVMLHGCTQNPEDFAAGTGMNLLSEEFGCVIAYPGQPIGANAQKCWNWFKPEDQVRGNGEPGLLAGLTRDVLRDFPVDSARVYVAGLSAGGAAANIMGSAYPDIFSAVGAHSGLPVGSAHDVPSAFAAMRNGSRGNRQTNVVPTIVFQGLADTTVNPKNGQAIVDQVAGHFTGVTKITEKQKTSRGRAVRTTRYSDHNQQLLAELWEVEGAGHAWSGGYPGGSYTDPVGPNASREMVRFFLEHRRDKTNS